MNWEGYYSILELHKPMRHLRIDNPINRITYPWCRELKKLINFLTERYFLLVDQSIFWLISSWQNELDGALADQMGLGKTIQTIGKNNTHKMIRLSAKKIKYQNMIRKIWRQAKIKPHYTHKTNHYCIALDSGMNSWQKEGNENERMKEEKKMIPQH